MKIYAIGGTYHYRLFEKIFRIMKLTIAFVLFAVLHVNAKIYSQDKFTFSMKDVSVKKIFKEIEKSSDYTVFYRLDQINLDQKVTIDASNATIDEVVIQSLQGQALTYKIVDKVIVIKPSSIDEEAMDLQEIIVSGTVTSKNNVPLAGVSVIEKNTTNGTATNNKGHFSLSVKDKNAILVFSSLGFKEVEVAVGDRKTINVTMDEENKVMDQVVVVGFGTQKKKDLTGAISTIGSKELENRANTQFGYAIEGKAAGVQVVRSSGQPQSGFSIRIRGTSSITSGSDPIYVVDGIPTNNTNEINPADIESITILKDASSAAIYGSKGAANGVVLITTKRGKNQKLKIGFNTSVSLSKAWKKMDVLDSGQFRSLMNDMNKITDWSVLKSNTNWQDEIFRNALTQNYQLSATGGTAKTAYYVSGSMINQNGIVLNNNLKRATLKANVDQQITKFLKAGTSLSYDNWRDRDVSENNRNGVIARLYTTLPNIGIRNPLKPEEYARSPFIDDLENPVSTVYQPDHLYKNNRFHGNVYAEAEVIKGLKLKSLFGFEKSDGVYTSFQDSIQTRYGQSLKGLAAKNTYTYKYFESQNTATYSKVIKDHNILVMGGFIASRETSDNLYKSSNNFVGAPNNEVESGNTKGNPIPDWGVRSNVAVIARLNYSYKDKYLVTSNFRADGSGLFDPQNRWGYFPSFSVGWRLSKEDFFKNIKGINDLKIRAGWGQTGNDKAANFGRYGLIDSNQLHYLIGGVVQTGYTPTSLENSALKWEKTSQYDLGIDLTVLDSRLTLTADYYYKKTSDLLLQVPIPGTVGIPGNTALQNAGSILNKGFEFMVNSKNIVQKNFKWNTDFNIAFNRGKVLDIVGQTIHSGTINPAGTSLNTAIVQAGLPLGSFYGKTSLGVDPSTGKIKFLQTKDASGDSVGVIGNASPKYIFGLTNSFSYKNFTLDVFFQGVHGNQILNATRILTESMVLPMNQSATVINRWKNPGDITNMPGVSDPADWSNSAVSTRYIENGSYVRLKALTLGYNLPQKVLSKLKMSRCMIYFTGENLLTFTKYSGFDPEVSAFSGNNQSTTDKNTAPGVDFGTYPQSRDFILGLNISF